jgi:hypothetical protein
VEQKFVIPKIALFLIYLSCIASVPLAFAASPPMNERIEFKTPTRSFNHVNDYAIQDHQLWSRKRNALNSPWREILFDAWNDEYPVEIKADGANLMVLASNRYIHYKKILKEKRTWGGEYRYKDLSFKDNWKSAWFSFPVIGWFSNPFYENRLYMPRDIVSWAMSHRGTYNHYFEDSRNRKHSEFSMVTTVYAIPRNGKGVLYADPFLAGGLTYEIPGPHPDFIGHRIDASASTIFLSGTLYGRRKLYERLADFDTMRKNPFLPGFWFECLATNQDWREIPLPDLVGAAQLKDDVTLFQNGEGNAARVLRIEGLDAAGSPVIYSKGIQEPHWNTIPIRE